MFTNIGGDKLFSNKSKLVRRERGVSYNSLSRTKYNTNVLESLRQLQRLVIVKTISKHLSTNHKTSYIYSCNTWQPIRHHRTFLFLTSHVFKSYNHIKSLLILHHKVWDGEKKTKTNLRWIDKTQDESEMDRRNPRRIWDGRMKIKWNLWWRDENQVESKRERNCN